MTDTLYRQIANDLIRRIDEKELLPGAQVPTELELCRSYDVSRITIRHAIRELVDKDLVYRVKGKGTFIKLPAGWDEFYPDKKIIGDSRLISAILPHSDIDSFELLRGIEHESKQHGFFISFHNSGGGTHEHEAELIEDLTQSTHSRGLIVYPRNSHENLSVFSRLAISGFPVVFIDRDIDGIPFPLVQTDNEGGMYDATKHLINLGHRRIAFASQDMSNVKPVYGRYLGYCRALIEAKIEIDESLVLDYASNLQKKDGSGADLMEYFFSRLEDVAPPTAYVMENDLTAIAFLRFAGEHGVHIPEDISVCGYDNLPVGEHQNPPLTTVEQPFFRIGELAARLLIGKFSGESKSSPVTTVATKLVERSSTAQVEKALVKQGAIYGGQSW